MTDNAIAKEVSDLNGYFMKEDTQMANKHVKRCFIELVIREVQNKFTMQFYYSPTSMAKI